MNARGWNVKKRVTKERRIKLLALGKEIRSKSPKIQQRLCLAGQKPDSAAVFSMAKYYGTLTRLAKE